MRHPARSLVPADFTAIPPPCRTMRLPVVASALALALDCSALVAQHEGGHGPHAAADARRDTASVGRIVFPIGAAPAAQRAFERGVGYMHNFLYLEAIGHFRRARALDSSAVLASSFEALAWTYPVWNIQDTAKARAALRTIAPTREARVARARTARERAWMEAIEALYADGTPKARRDTAFADAMAALHAAHPRDPEAGAFHALALLGLNQGERDPTSYARAEAMADGVLRTHPRHPGALHYKIHAVDDPANAARGMAAARRYGDVAPGAHHARHMTSHIFIARGMWDDVVAANRRAVAAAPRFSLHYLHWLVYGLLQQGRPREARAWTDSMLAFTRESGAGGVMAQRGAAPLFAAAWVVDAEAWDDSLAHTRFDGAPLQPPARAIAWFHAGYAAARRANRPVEQRPGSRVADRSLADSAIAALDQYAGALRAGRATARPGETPAAAAAEADVMADLVRAEQLAGAGRRDSALAVLRAAAVRWESQPFAFGPPAVFVPPRERLAQALLLLNRPAQALAQADSAERMTPGRTQLLRVRLRALDDLGRHAEARRVAARLDSIYRAAEPGAPAAADARIAAGRVPAWVRAARVVGDTVGYASRDTAGAPLALRGARWRPTAPGPHPALVVLHGSGGCWHPGEADDLGRRFAARGFVAFFPCRRGLGLSRGQGEAIMDQLRREGLVGRDSAYARRSTELLLATQLPDVQAAIAAVRAMPGVDAGRVGVTGISYGGILTLLAAEHDSTLRAAVAFAPAAMNWSWNTPLRERLLAGARRTRVPTRVLQAANDWSVGPTEAIPAAMREGGGDAAGRLHPAVGHNANDGHGFMVLAPEAWEPEVYAFLDRHLAPGTARGAVRGADATARGRRPHVRRGR